MAYCGWARQGELPVRPGRILESEEPVHPPAAIRLPQQEGDVPPELRPAQAARVAPGLLEGAELRRVIRRDASRRITRQSSAPSRSEEHTSELQSQSNLVCRLLLEKKKQLTKPPSIAYTTRS